MTPGDKPFPTSCWPPSGCVASMLLRAGSEEEGGDTASTVTHRLDGYLLRRPDLRGVSQVRGILVLSDVR